MHTLACIVHWIICIIVSYYSPRIERHGNNFGPKPKPDLLVISTITVGNKHYISILRHHDPSWNILMGSEFLNYPPKSLVEITTMMKRTNSTFNEHDSTIFISLITTATIIECGIQLWEWLSSGLTRNEPMTVTHITCVTVIAVVVEKKRFLFTHNRIGINIG